MTISTEELKELLAETTPGPWKWDDHFDGLKGVFSASCAQNMEFLSWSDWIDVAPAGSCFDERMPVSKEANARLIALAPELAAEVIALRADNERLTARHPNPADHRYWEGRYRDEKAENERLRDALLFYADVGKYPTPFTGGMGDLWQDCGQIARAALNNTPEPA